MNVTHAPIHVCTMTSMGQRKLALKSAQNRRYGKRKSYLRRYILACGFCIMCVHLHSSSIDVIDETLTTGPERPDNPIGPDGPLIVNCRHIKSSQNSDKTLTSPSDEFNDIINESKRLFSNSVKLVASIVAWYNPIIVSFLFYCYQPIQLFKKKIIFFSEQPA